MPNEQPNILLITTDTQRWDTLRCQGSSFAISPNLDALAAQGVLFENAHTSSPVCMPTRCSLMTGVHTPVHGCIENGFSRYDHLPMLTDLLDEAGYHNIMVGKAHMGPVPDSFHVQRLTHGEKNRDADDFYAELLAAHDAADGARCADHRLRRGGEGEIAQRTAEDRACVDRKVAPFPRMPGDGLAEPDQRDHVDRKMREPGMEKAV